MSRNCLMIRYDGAESVPVSLLRVLTWRDWSHDEARKLIEIAQGRLRRMSTEDKDGVPCDLERNPAA